ncbi:hypothetical protein Moror_8438, partial [Moniliophthora roreri MCA 2997]
VHIASGSDVALIQYNVILDQATPPGTNIYGNWTGSSRISSFNSEQRISACYGLVSAFGLPETASESLSLAAALFSSSSQRRFLRRLKHTLICNLLVFHSRCWSVKSGEMDKRHLIAPANAPSSPSSEEQQPVATRHPILAREAEHGIQHQDSGWRPVPTMASLPPTYGDAV